MKKSTNRLLAGLLSAVIMISLIPAVLFADDPDLTISTSEQLWQFAAEVNGGNSYEGMTVTLTDDIALEGENSPWTAIGTSSNSFKGCFDGQNHIISGLYITEGSNIGLFGHVSGGSVKNLTVKGSVTGIGSVAGVVGSLNAGTVQNCGNNADVTGQSAVGGVVGYVGGDSVVSGCYNSGSVTGTGYIGGVTGQHWRAGTVENCYNVGGVTGPATVGGVVGGHKAASPTVTNCYNAGAVTDTAGRNNNIGAVVGATRGTNTNCYYLKGTDSKTGISETSELSADMLGSAFADDTDNINSGYPVLKWQEKVPDIIIGSYEQLKDFADSVNGGNTYDGKLIRLDVNIALGGSDNPWTPIATFKGTFDGNYHVISDLYIASGSSAGFFGNVNGGTVRNLVIKGSVSGSANVAGVIGSLTAGVVQNCGNEATVSGASNVGGVVGAVNGDSIVSGCYNSGSVTGTTGYIGGVTGQHWRAGTVKDCCNTGIVTGPATVGGVVGGHKAASPAVTNCFNAGAVVDATGSNNNIGAVIGATRGTNTNCYYFSGTGTDSKTGISEVTTLAATALSDAFIPGPEHPILAWETNICTDTPVQPPFVESSELSAQLSAYIKAAVNSAKSNAGLTSTETLLGNPNYMSGASSTATDWMALAMGRFGYYHSGSYTYMINDGTGYEDYLSALKTYIETTYQENGGVLHSAKATEWHRAVAAITALGGDPTNFGTYKGQPINLIADGSYNCSLKAGPGTQGINGWIWGLIAMDTGDYEIPANAKYTRQTFITEILKMQLTDGVNDNEYGGWVLGGYGNTSDVDITAMALQALAPYYNDDTVYTYTNQNSNKEVTKTVRQCVDEALDRLGAMMNGDGGFTSWNTNNVESISQVIVALCSLGIDPVEDSRFVTANGTTLLDGLLQFRIENGGFCHVLNGGWNSMANDQATYALVAYWRLENGLRSLYDAREDQSAQVKAAVDAAIKTIEELPAPSNENYKASIKQALTTFRAVPKNERRYVNNYSQLAAALDLIGGEAELNTNAPYIVSISVTTAPTKLKYYEGEAFDPAGMAVTAVYSNGVSKPLTDYKISVTKELTTSDTSVIILYGVLKTSIDITVRQRMPWSGDGTEENPYLIRTADDLVDLDDYVRYKNFITENVYFKVTEDINMIHVQDWHAIAGDASYRNEGFRGHFDGNGHAIWNLNSHVNNSSGLFGKLGDGAVIENIGIASGSIGGSYHTSLGGIAAHILSNADVTIQNCYNAADLSGTFGIGGIVGYVDPNGRLTVENCRNFGTISASYTGGGIIGSVGENNLQNNGAEAVVKNCYNTGTIRGAGSWGAGGIIGAFRLNGENVYSEIIDCYNAGTVTGAVPGAIIGSACESDIRIKNVYYLDTSAAQANGVLDNGTYAPGTITGQMTARTASEMKRDAFVSELGTAYIKDTQQINNGYPILNRQTAIGQEAPVRAGLEIGTAAELKAFADRVNAGESFTNKTVALTAHIDLSNYTDWTPIGASSKNQFDGVFDGRGYVIDNLVCTNGGLFGYVCENAIIKNVGVASGEIGSSAANTSFMGAIAKWSNGADIINCWNGADIYASGYSGGIVGTIRDGGKSTIAGCYNTGSIYGKDTAVGGIVGHIDTTRTGTSVEVTVKDCYNAGYVSGQDSVAGIVGKAQDGHRIINCYNAGQVVSETANEAGAIAGSVTSDNIIENCFYNSDMISVGVCCGIDTTTGKTTAELKSTDFPASLGTGFKPDAFALVNGGYPLLSWQNSEDADAINAVINLIDKIGTVTAESGDKISAARTAYNALDDDFKPYVSNSETLVKAESDLAAAQELVQAKNTAKQALDNYKTLSDYRNEQAEQIAQLIADGKTAIDSAADTQTIAEALQAATAAIDAIKTDKQLSDEESAQALSKKIAEIGDITAEVLKQLRAEYDALSDEAKALVTNYDVLTKAEEGLMKPLQTDTVQSVPETSDTTDFTLYISIMAISLFAIFVLTKKKAR